MPLYVSKGATFEKALDYAVSGCTEARMPNRDTYTSGGAYINFAAAVEMVLRNGRMKKFGDQLLGAETAAQVERTTLAIYEAGRTYAAGRGIIVADTKFEFGFIDGKLHLIDEVLTPDSSRFWPADQYKPGQGQPSFDKQYLRDWLEKQPWNKQPPPPALPEEVIKATANRYQEAYDILTK